MRSFAILVSPSEGRPRTLWVEPVVEVRESEMGIDTKSTYEMLANNCASLNVNSQKPQVLE